MRATCYQKSRLRGEGMGRPYADRSSDPHPSHVLLAQPCAQKLGIVRYRSNLGLVICTILHISSMYDDSKKVFSYLVFSLPQIKLERKVPYSNNQTSRLLKV